MSSASRCWPLRCCCWLRNCPSTATTCRFSATRTTNLSTTGSDGTLGAYLAWWFFLPFGLVAYLVPPLLAIFGAAYLLDFLSYLRERIRWSLLWSGHAVDRVAHSVCSTTSRTMAGCAGELHETIGAQSIGGWLGWLTYGQTQNRNFGLSLLGPLGATIVYSALALISLLFLTNFQLGEWIPLLFRQGISAAEAEKKSPGRTRPRTPRARFGKSRRRNCGRSGRALRSSRRGRKTGSAGTDRARFERVPAGNPADAGGRFRKTTLPESKIPAAPAPADEGEVIPAKEIVAATTEHPWR